MYTEQTLKLSHHAVLKMLQTAVATAEKMGQPQCIVIVDASASVLGQIRMSGAKVLSMKSATAKARTAASIGAKSDAIPDAVGLYIAAATGGDVTSLTGGLPIYMDSELLGGIGVGSGAPEQDRSVAQAALDAIGATSQA